MAEKIIYSTELEISNGLSVEVSNNTVKVKGKKGENQRTFLNPRISIKKENNLLVFKTNPGLKQSSADKMFINTYKSHIKNMFFGVENGYNAKLKICSGHFPMNVSIDKNNVVIKNFLGEKLPRKCTFPSDVQVKIEGDSINITGIDKEKVGQTAANIEQCTRITNRDRRIFQDGCYITSKPGDKNE